MAETTPQGPVSLTRDASVVKTVLQPGSDDPAGRGAHVRLSYKLRLTDDEHGDVVDSSTTLRGGALKFTTGRSKVIAALDLAAQSMRLGERARVRAESHHAFGSRGLPRRGVPPGATVFLEVEMLEFEGGEKVKPLDEMTPRERFDKAKVFKEEGNQLFKEVKFEKAMFSYSQCIRLLSNVFYKSDSAKQQKPDADAPDADKADEQNDEQNGEQAPVSNDDRDDTQGTTDLANGKPDESGFAQAEVVDDAPAKAPALSSDGAGEKGGADDEVEFIDVSTASRADGATVPNGSAEPVQTATEVDKENTATQEKATEEQEEDLPKGKEITALHVTTLNNLSLCFIKMEEYRRAVESATLALRLDDGSSKALYYRGRALEALGEWDKAREDLTAAAKIQPNNVGIRMEIAKLEKKRKVHHSLERKQAAAMFA